ncbi:hypothetical protein [Aliivibrio fischeri]|uniref:hypothetical protein n=1 Tax=Aliivibrio fischeri TaxID=668 RepID=UPI0012D96D48|nr:hypothetical protein [Aliivibrio fischeri]
MDNNIETIKKSKCCFVTFLVPTYIVIYTLFSIWLLIDGWINGFSSIFWLWSITPETSTLPPPVYNLLFTMLGALLGCAVLGITSFHRYKAIDKAFDIDHLSGFILAPILALIIGLLIFAMLQSGLVVLTNQSVSTGNTNPETTATLGYLAIGGISGYNWDVFVKKLQELSANVMNTTPQEKNANVESINTKEDEK